MAIDCNLRKSLSADYKKYFQDYCSSLINLPADFKYPFTLHFSDGSLEVLWAETKD